jgi:hypothetical protein
LQRNRQRERSFTGFFTDFWGSALRTGLKRFIISTATLSGFKDEDNVPLGRNPKYPKLPVYRDLTLNEFLAKHYVIEDAGPIFLKVTGPFLGMRQFIVAATRWSAGRRLIDELQHDMLRFMSPEAAKSILEDLQLNVPKINYSTILDTHMVRKTNCHRTKGE